MKRSGRADDIQVVRPVGVGTEGDAINALLAWKFKPSADYKGKPVAVQVPIEIAFDWQ
jgi:hypothetical protein